MNWLTAIWLGGALLIYAAWIVYWWPGVSEDPLRWRIGAPIIMVALVLLWPLWLVLYFVSTALESAGLLPRV